MDDSWPVQLPLQSPAIQSSEILRLQQQSPTRSRSYLARRIGRGRCGNGSRKAWAASQAHPNRLRSIY